MAGPNLPLQLQQRIKVALGRRVPDHIRGGSFERSHAYVELAGELQAACAGRRPFKLAVEALRRFEDMQREPARVGA